MANASVVHGDSLGDNSIYCYRAMLTTSTGIWLGDNPLHFSLPILLYQIILIFLLSNLTHLLLRRFGQPLIVSQVVAGWLLGPNFLGKSPIFDKMFTQQSFQQLGTIAGFSFMLFYFVVGVKVDLTMIPKAGRKAVAMAMCGTLLPYLFVFLAARAMTRDLPPQNPQSHFMLIFVDRWSVTSYAVLSGVLAEFNLLTTKVGRLAMSATILSDIVHLFVIACIGTFVTGFRRHGDALQGLTGMLSFLAMAALIMFVLRPLVLWLCQRTPEGELLGEASFMAILLMAVGCSLMGIFIGFDCTTGPFFFGMVLPGGAPLGTTLVERLDRFITGVILPLALALAGMRIDLTSLVNGKEWGVFVILIAVAVATKFVGTVLPCFCTSMPRREVFATGLMMINKGIHEVGCALEWIDSKVVDDQIYTIVIICILLLAGSTTPLLKSVYRPEDRFLVHDRRTLQHAEPDGEFRILACVHDQDNVNPILSLLEAAGPSSHSPICVYLLHLIQLIGRADAILIHYKLHSSAPISDSDHIVNAFKLFEKQFDRGCIWVLPYICISPYNSMHDDVCSLALDKNTTIVILPFHKQAIPSGNFISGGGHAMQAFTVNVLQYAPCSVGILVNSFLEGGGPLQLRRVAVYFFGGADDREALALGARLAGNCAVGLTVVRFLPSTEWLVEGPDAQADEQALMRFRIQKVDGERVEYREEAVRDSEETMGVIRETSGQFNLLVVGRRVGEDSPLTVGLSMWSEHPELGAIGDLLASTDFGCRAATLVVQQQTRVAGDGTEGFEAFDDPPKAKRVVPRNDGDY
ncbi:hypothetical protein ZIOFF_072411 [Zingiber officinale]|uniref:Cation/H+ exchanger domain-containing protein n=1 Tax=Zingiber officinale TaxID=94328 RepID=A0A8J5ETA1_ZINOF|nr:hypothetical protein ZIOFF_072411 [Zingiber officinale]